MNPEDNKPEDKTSLPMAPEPNIPNQSQTPPVAPPPPAPSPDNAHQTRTMEQDMRKPVFDADEPVFTPETDNQLMQPVGPGIGTGKPRVFLKWFVILTILVALVLVGYFVIYPLFVGDAEPDPGTAQIPIAVQPHVSAFAGMGIKKVVVSLRENPSVADMNLVFSQQGELAENGLTEVVFNDKDGDRINFTSLMAIIDPGASSLNTANSIFDVETYFTSFFYKDDSGVWPGYIVRQTAGVPDASITDWLAALESSNLAAFFTGDPGTFSEFVDGSIVNGSLLIPDRYAPASVEGVSFSYLQSGDKVVIGTSYNLMQEVVTLLGL